MLMAHLADSHVGPMGSKLDPATGLNARMMDRARCLKFCVEDAVKRDADLIIFCGDFWDGPRHRGLGCRPTPTEVGLVKEALRPAIDADIAIVAVLGNHDAAKASNEWHAMDLLAGLHGLTIIDNPCLLDVWENGHGQFRVSPAASEEERAKGDATVLQLACLPYPNPQLLLRDEEARKLSPGDRNLEIRQKMMDVARGLAADRLEGVPRLLLVHAAFDTAEAGASNSLAMLSAEWTLNVHEVAAVGFDAVLAGHYHRRQVLNEEPWIGYCGSPECCSMGEEADGDKGYYLHDPGGLLVPTFFPAPYRRFVTLDAEQDFEKEGKLAADAPSIEDAIVRVDLPPYCPFTVAQAQKAIEAAGAFEARVTQARAETERRRETGLTHGMALDEQLRAWLELKPDLDPLTDQIIGEAMVIEEAVRGGAA